jgi:hypothetical protein
MVQKGLKFLVINDNFSKIINISKSSQTWCDNILRGDNKKTKLQKLNNF